jgi:response regulator RpfG family c-di-GMP phosphodiesterase
MITILYIDDEPLNLMLFEDIFKNEFNVITGLSGFVGMEKLNQHPEISIVFSDMKMPGMNGIEFIVQAKKEHQDKTYFLITGYDITDEIANALENKIISKYFGKPFNIEEIRKTINNNR